MTSIRKADASPEEWAAHLEHVRQWRLKNLEHALAQRRAYCARPEVQEKRRLYDNRPDIQAKRLARNRTPEAKTAAKKRYRQRCAEDPTLQKRRNAFNRKLRTGFDEKLVATLVLKQGNRCAICQVSFDERQMHADHCHDTNRPRGLLCRHCNNIDGLLSSVGMDVVQFAHRLVSYRKCPPALNV